MATEVRETERGMRRLLLTGLMASLPACAGLNLESPGPERIPELQQQVGEQPTDAEQRVALGEAYYNGSRYTEAQQHLERALELEPGNDRAILFLAFTLDELEDYAGARTQYNAVLKQRSSGTVMRAAEQRLLLLDRKEALVAARDALTRETELSRIPPPENTIAVLPLLYTGTDESLRPLERGLAEIFASDLGVVSRLTVVERLRVQALIDEMRLGQTSRADARTAARSGRLVRASNVIQATLGDAQDGQLRLDASLVAASTSQVVGRSSQSDQLAGLLQMEKRAVLDIVDLLGVELTPAERERITEMPTENMLAFLQFSEGLGARDRGDFGAAEASFRRAAALDPSFAVAGQAAQFTGQLSSAQAASPAELAPQTTGSLQRAAARTRLQQVVARLTPTGADLLAGGDDDAGETRRRKEVQEGVDRQGPTDAARKSVIVVVVRNR